MHASPVVLITGASSGIGLACANHLHSAAFRVYGTSRRPPGQFDCGFSMIQVDVGDDESVGAAVDDIVSREGRLDAVINCAGYGLAGSIEDTSIEEAKAQFEPNFYGVMRMCRSVLPVMKDQKSGFIINIGSLAGQIGLPFQGIYSATKFALEGFSEALRLETRAYGVRTVLIEPGDYHTGFTDNRHISHLASGNSHYRKQFDTALAIMKSNEVGGPTPENIAALVFRILKKRSPRLRYLAGHLHQRLAFRLSKTIPHRIFAWIISRYFKIA